MDKENRPKLDDISKISHTLAITHGDKPSAPSGKGYTPAAFDHTVEPFGECGKHTAENYTHSDNQALHLMKSTNETGSAFLSPVRSAFLHNDPTRNHQISLQSESTTNRKNEAQTSHSDKQLRLSAVIDEGKGADALTEVTSAKNKIASSSNIAVSPVNKMLDKAECDNLSVSPSPSSVVVRKEGEGEQSLTELDFATSASPLRRKQKKLHNTAIVLITCITSNHHFMALFLKKLTLQFCERFLKHISHLQNIV